MLQCAALLVVALVAAPGVSAAAVEANLESADSLTIDFGQPMQSWANELTADTVSVTPGNPATCYWSSDTRLSCRLQEPLPLASRHVLTVLPGLKTQRGEVLDTLTMRIETARPWLRIASVDWKDGLPSIDIEANMPVAIDEVRGVLRLSLDGRRLATPVLHRAPARWSGDPSIRYAIPLDGLGARNRMLQVAVVPGLRSRAGPLRGQQRASLGTFHIRPPFALQGVVCSQRDTLLRTGVRLGAVHAACIADEPLKLVFSSKLHADAKAQIARAFSTALAASAAGGSVANGALHTQMAPSPFAADGVQTPPAEWIILPGLPAGADVRFALDATVRSSDSIPMRAVALHVQATEPRPRLQARYRRALVADARVMPELLSSINAGPVTLHIDALGEQSRRDAMTVPSTRGHAEHPVASAVAARALAQGGWARVTPDTAITPPRYRDQSVEFAAPGFDLLAVAANREVLVWATGWDDQAGVAGADIELVWRSTERSSMQTVARGRTDGDGIARLRLPDSIVVEPPSYDGSGQQEASSWWVRARTAGDGQVHRAVLPLAEDAPLGLAASRRTWGVSDRPLYRAGETVRYRLWQRDVHGMRLQSPAPVTAVDLQLAEEDEEQVILAWTIVPGSDGSIHGELELPVHLTDATYCIGARTTRSTEGACFHVGSHRAQDLWVKVASDGRVLRDGEPLHATLSAGYFSGGPAAGATVETFDVELWPVALSEAYPEYADFSFIDVYADHVTSPGLVARSDGTTSLDEAGRLQAEWQVAFRGPADEVASRAAFGILQIDAGVGPAGRDASYASDETTRYARFERYVGLRTTPGWFDADDVVRLDAIVITAEGARQDDVPAVEVAVDFIPGWSSTPPAEDGNTERIARCSVVPGTVTRCDFPRRRSGRYRLTARVGDAAPTVIERYLSIEGSDETDDESAVEPGLEVTHPTVESGVMKLRLTQPFDHSRTLLVSATGDAILDHKVVAGHGLVQSIDMPVDEQWSGMLGVRAFVREVAPPRVVDGFRLPAEMLDLEATLHPRPGEPPEDPVTVAFAAPSARPGEPVAIAVTNHSDAARDVVLAVMDDALREQAQRWLPYADPDGPAWLYGGYLWRGAWGLDVSTFADWGGEAWRWLLPWDGAPPAASDAASVADAPGGEVLAFDDAFAQAAAHGFDDDSQRLERIEVTGSRIKRADFIENLVSEPPDPSLRFDQDARPRPGAERSPATWRSRFADTAMWVPDMRLSAGETRTLQLVVPDNLTRWRAVAWSADDGADFAMTDATLDAGLPVEVRLQAPSRLFPGDVTDVATSVRHVAGQPRDVETALVVDDAEGQHIHLGALQVPAQGQASGLTTLAPSIPGALQLVASASTADGGDAVGATVEVATPLRGARLVQAGWIGDGVLEFELPGLPDGATATSLRVSLLRGDAGLVTHWTQDLREYPHRCWEQILSRAVAAALALERGVTDWPDAQAVVDEALHNAAVFQNLQGGLRYFPGGGHHAPSSVPLTAYTVRAFDLLRRLGQPVPAAVLDQAAKHLLDEQERLGELQNGRRAPSAHAPGGSESLAALAFSAAVRAPARRESLDPLWRAFGSLPVPVQMAAAEAFMRAGHPATADAIRRLLERVPTRGGVRVLRLRERFDQWMSSDLREQCSLIGLLAGSVRARDDGALRELRAGLTDLYSGGVGDVDTQTAAICLMTLQEPGMRPIGSVTAHVSVGEHEKSLHLVPGSDRVDWEVVGVPSASTLRVAADRSDAPNSLLAELSWLEDVGRARPSAVGMSIERRYAVFAEGGWQPVDGQDVHAGDWIRVTLVVSTNGRRHFVAVTDDVPGGLQPTDLDLSAVAGSDVRQVADLGSAQFASRRLDSRSPRFYAETLGAGRHEVHYFARVSNSGDYLAAPATAELMYGSATHARTSSTRLRFAPRAANDASR